MNNNYFGVIEKGGWRQWDSMSVLLIFYDLKLKHVVWGRGRERKKKRLTKQI